ncbi:bifunctional adenosylcobinamide kinase/adenosylcobinamide-phosphate guanylyltransferase [Escherichia coli]
MMILVTGGARSGKSRHAEALIGDSSQVLYIATSQILDDEMAVLLECVTTMVTNLLFDYGGDKDPDEWDYQAMEQAINAEIQSLIAACQRCPAKVVLVTNEVGMGIVPESRLARHFRDIAGRVNQQLAAAANEVWLVVSGIGVKIK